MTDLVAMTCEDAEALLPLVADGVLDSEADPQLFAHLATCPDCQEALAAHDLVDLALSAEPVGTASGDATTVTVPWPVAIIGGLAAAAAVVIAVMTLQEQPAEVEPVPVASTEVVDVIQDEDGVTVYVIKRDGELLMVRELDQSDAAVEPIDSVPVMAPSR